MSRNFCFKEVFSFFFKARRLLRDERSLQGKKFPLPNLGDPHLFYPKLGDYVRQRKRTHLGGSSYTKVFPVKDLSWKSSIWAPQFLPHNPKVYTCLPKLTWPQNIAPDLIGNDSVLIALCVNIYSFHSRKSHVPINMHTRWRSQIVSNFKFQRTAGRGFPTGRMTFSNLLRRRGCTLSIAGLTRVFPLTRCLCFSSSLSRWGRWFQVIAVLCVWFSVYKHGREADLGFPLFPRGGGGVLTFQSLCHSLSCCVHPHPSPALIPDSTQTHAGFMSRGWRGKKRFPRL